MQEDVYRGDGLNLYAYCANNPVMYYDPSGYDKQGDKLDNTSINNEGGSNTRNIVDTKGLRNDLPLKEEQYEELVSYATQLGFPVENIAPYNIDSPFETGLAYGSRLYINNDVLPSNSPSKNPNSLVSGKGAIAHEVIGHYETVLKGTSFETQYFDVDGSIKINYYNLALDEAQASIRAARFAPDLTLSERLVLIKDGIMRLKKQGIKIKDVREMLDILER